MTLRQSIRTHLGIWAVGIAVVTLTGLLSRCGGQTYSCGDAVSNHCYGVVNWGGSPTGFSMEMTAVPLTSGDIFIDDEGWLIDYISPTDVIWVETGEENVNVAYFGGHGTTYYFWAYGAAGGEFMGYDLGPVAQSDLDHANWIEYRISQDSTTPSTWHVNIWQAATGTMLFNESVDNPMTPNTVTEGQELAGSNGAQAPLAFFTANAYTQGSKQGFQTSDGTVCLGQSPACPGGPPNAGWWFSSKPSQTSNGGMFFTDCC